MLSTEEQQNTSIQRIHQQQLKSGIKNDEYEHEIVQILGGIDEILTVWFQSNSNGVLMTDKQKDNIHQILTKSHKQQPKKTKLLLDSNNVEDKGMNQNIIYTFNDQDTLLFSLFHTQKALNILKVIQSKIIIGVLAMMWLAVAVLFIFANYGLLDVHVYYVYGSLLWLVYFIYIIFWLLYTNKVAMKLIILQFEFLFKMFYMIQWICVNVGMRYLGIYSQPWYLDCLYYLVLTAFLFWVIVFDAVNIKRENKLIISCLAAGLFSMNTLEHLRISYFRDQYTLYTAATVTTGFGAIKISLIDVSYNAAMILSFFMFNQILLSIINPSKSSLIRKKPIIKYENINNTISKTTCTEKHIQKWRILCILCCCLGCSGYIYYSTTSSTRKLQVQVYIILMGSCSFIVLVCLLMNRMKYLYFSICIILVYIVLTAGGVFFLHVNAVQIISPLVGFGIFSIYVLKVIEFRKLKADRPFIESPNIKKENRTHNDNNVEEQMDIQMEIIETMKHKRESTSSLSSSTSVESIYK